MEMVNEAMYAKKILILGMAVLMRLFFWLI